MSNLFTRQLNERAAADEAMRQEAERLIDDVVSRDPSGDLMDGFKSNEAALERILSLCGIDRDRLDHLETEDILFTPVDDDSKWYRFQAGYCIARDETGRMVALLPGLFHSYYFLDEKGKKKPVTSDNAGQFQKVYSLCRLLPDRKLGIADLLRYLLSYMRKKTMLLYIFITLFAGVLGLAFPRVVNLLLSNAQATGGSVSEMMNVALLCVAAELVRLALSMMLAAFAGSFTTMVTYNVKNAVLSRYLSKTGGDAGRDTSQVWTAISARTRNIHRLTVRR